MQFIIPFIQTAILCVSLRPSPDVPIADRLTPSEVEAVAATHERVELPVETQLLVPDGGAAEAVEPRSGTRFGAVCYVYLKENGIFVRRFAVHVTDREGLPTAKTAARFMALIWGTAENRFGTLSRRLRARPVDLWLTRTGQAGGEQTGSSIFIYDVAADRSPIEWARELAHEYGHYLLPGASGYTDPENWSNGLLGERLFLRWLRTDVAIGRVKPEMLSYVKPADLDDYCEKQPEALIDRVRRRGIDSTLLKKRDAAAMDEFSALILYADATYGPKTILDMLDHLPEGAAAGAKAEDFLAALGAHLNSAAGFSTIVAAGSPVRTLIPKGKYRVTSTGDVTGVSIDRGTAAASSAGAWAITVAETGWRALTVKGSKAVSLHWERL